jgi:hypothetical protein
MKEFPGLVLTVDNRKDTVGTRRSRCWVAPEATAKSKTAASMRWCSATDPPPTRLDLRAAGNLGIPYLFYRQVQPAECYYYPPLGHPTASSPGCPG